MSAVAASGHWDVWPSDPLVVPLVLAVPTALYLAGWLAMRRAGRLDAATLPRALAFLAGIEVLVIAFISPLHHVANHYLLSAHMIQHMLVGDVAPLLIVLGVSGPLAAMVPARVRGLAGPPWAAFLAWAAVTGLWYVPAVFARAMSSFPLHVVMQTSIVLGGLAAWAHIVGVVPRPMSHAQRAGFAMGLMGVGLVVSETLFLSGPLYPLYIDQADRVWGLTPQADQVKAALIMASEGMITMVTAAALLMWAHVDRAAEPGDVTSSPPCAPSESSR